MATKFTVTDHFGDSDLDNVRVKRQLYKLMRDFGLRAVLPSLPARIRYYHFSSTTIPDPDFATPCAGTLTVFSGDCVFTWWLDQENLDNPIFIGKAKFKD